HFAEGERVPDPFRASSRHPSSHGYLLPAADQPDDCDGRHACTQRRADPFRASSRLPPSLSSLRLSRGVSSLSTSRLLLCPVSVSRCVSRSVSGFALSFFSLLASPCCTESSPLLGCSSTPHRAPIPGFSHISAAPADVVFDPRKAGFTVGSIDTKKPGFTVRGAAETGGHGAAGFTVGGERGAADETEGH
ncbi:unnamed protein product, partial [Musa acuminata subsp. malaccensis]